MSVTGSIPTRICYVSNEPVVCGGMRGLSSYPNVSGRHAYVLDASRPSDEARIVEDRYNRPSCEHTFSANSPVSGLRIVDRYIDRGRTFYKVIDQEGRVFTTEDHVIIDSGLHDTISNGVIGGSFVWAKVPYMGLILVRVGSAAHLSICAHQAHKSAPGISLKSMMPGDVLQTSSYSLAVYLGAFETIRAKWSERGVFDFTPEKIRLFFRPTTWGLANPRGTIESVGPVQLELDRVLSSHMESYQTKYTFRTNMGSFKSCPSKISLPCGFHRTLSSVALGWAMGSLESIRRRGWGTQEYRAADMRKALEAYSYLINLSDLNSTPQPNQIFVAAQSML